jgi:hypothetical protein
MLRSALEVLRELVALTLFTAVVLLAAVLYIGFSNGILQ